MKAIQKRACGIGSITTLEESTQVMKAVANAVPSIKAVITDIARRPQFMDGIISSTTIILSRKRVSIDNQASAN